MDELIARILSLIRRYTRFNRAEETSGKICFDGLAIDADSRTVVSVNGSFELPPKEFDVLFFCAARQGKILTKQQIYEAVWKEPYVYDDGNIMAIISRIREKIEENPGNPRYIQTIKGIGHPGIPIRQIAGSEYFSFLIRYRCKSSLRHALQRCANSRCV